MDARVTSALIGALAAIAVLLIREVSAWQLARRSEGHSVRLQAMEDKQDLLIERMKRFFEIETKSREHAKNQLELLTLYVQPLLTAIEKLQFRLTEIFQGSGKIEYLLSTAAKTDFFEYKRDSTYYRVFAVFGWIRAYHRERALLDEELIDRDDQIDKCLKDVAKAFADGQHVDQRRLEELASLWSSTAVKESAASRLASAVLCDVLQKYRSKTSTGSPAELPIEDQAKLCQEISDILSQQLGLSIDKSRVNESLDKAIQVLGIREAWIFRDWQDGLGDLMIVESDSGHRRYDVIGFRSFESRLIGALTSPPSKASHDIVWIDRVSRMFTDLDLQNDKDARVQQLRNVQQALNDLVDTLRERLKEIRKGSKYQISDSTTNDGKEK